LQNSCGRGFISLGFSLFWSVLSVLSYLSALRFCCLSLYLLADLSFLRLLSVLFCFGLLFAFGALGGGVRLSLSCDSMQIRLRIQPLEAMHYCFARNDIPT